MSIIGKTAVAPCGHTGEVIIGTYVRCSQGCEGPAYVPPRGTVGHVINCACKPCQLRRKTHTIVLRDDKGNDFVKVEWDGVSDVIKTKAPKEGPIKHYHFLDADGKVIAKGDTSAYVAAGDIKIQVKFMVDALVARTVAKSVVTSSNGGRVVVTLLSPNGPVSIGSNVWAPFAGLIP